MGAAIDRFPVLVQDQHPFRYFWIIDVEFRLVQAMSCGRTAGGGRRGGANRLRIQVNDDPSQIAFTEDIVGPDNRSDGLRTPTNTCDDVLPNIRIESFGTVGRIMQPRNRQSDSHSQTDAIVADRFLQDHKAAGVFLFIRNDAAECHFTPEGIQRVLWIEDGCFNAEHFKLLQVAPAGIANANQC